MCAHSRDASDFLERLGITGYSFSPVTILCGAGISYPPPSSLPTVTAFIESSCVYCTEDAEVREAIGRAVRGRGVSPRFEVLVNAISQLGIEAGCIGALFDSAEPNALHRFVARQCQAGAAVVTTNFDNCIERAMDQRYGRVVFRGVDLADIGPEESVIVKPHGSNPLDGSDPAGELVLSIRTLARTAKGFSRFPGWRAYLNSLMHGRTLIVMGYSGSDDFDITPVLLESDPAHVIWIEYAAGSPPQISDLAAATAPIERICSRLPSTYLRGDVGLIVPTAFADGPYGRSRAGDLVLPHLNEWLQSAFSSAAKKQALLCAILRHYGQHELTVRQTEIPQSAEAVLERGAALYYLGKYKECRESLNAIESWTPTRIQQCQAAYLVSSACFYSGDTTEATQANRSHIELAEELHDIGELQTGLIHAGSLAYSIGDLEQARANYQRVLDYQHEYPSLQTAATARWGIAVIESVSGNERAAIEGYTSARELCEQIGSSQGVAWIDANLGELLIRAGQYSEAATHLADAEARFAEQGVAAGLLHTLACRARLEYSTGRRIPARETLHRCGGLLKTHFDFPALTAVLALSYLVAFELDDRPFLEEVRAAAREALRKGAEFARMGLAEDRRALCQQVQDAELPDEQVYKTCRRFIAGDQVEEA